ncbi:hypothetical protein [Clostridium sp.]|uniref:hypothetical protein n=1 Tax=Clostridium sp. TaxID=1506 RepID=UPI002620A506|nr:hypothetical protein [Clostridium sp.]
MKKAMDVFAEEGLKFFGIDKKVKDSSSTEIVVLEAKNLHMDYTFLMEDDTYIHVEFQTTDKGKDDLRRFRAYESLLSFQTSKDVVTYVVYSNGIHNTKYILQTGINEYNVKPISMYDKDGDIVIKEVEEKLNNNIEVTKQDLVALTFTPIMSGKLTKLDRIIKSIRIAKKINNEYRYDVESMLYAFADKFLDGKDLEKVKEEISMTKLGEMLVEDGIKKGKEEQATDTALKAIEMGLDNEAITKLTGLTDKEINLLRRAKNN